MIDAVGAEARTTHLHTVIPHLPAPATTRFLKIIFDSSALLDDFAAASLRLVDIGHVT
jgi:hypothetical protein